MKWPGPGIILMLLFVTVATLVPGCTTDPGKNLTAGELGTVYLDHAALVHDYQARYDSKSEGTVRFLWKAPSLYRMEYVDSPNMVAGTFATINTTTAAWYDAGQKTYNILPGNRDLPAHDYQAMVQRIVQDGRYTVTGVETVNGHACSVIEVIDEPWSMRYTPYVTTRVQAWIDPGSGLAWKIKTFYPADTENNVINYNRIEVNTGMPNETFSFVPPAGSSLQCGYGAGTAGLEKLPGNFSPALHPGCSTCTDALLTNPVGGFHGNRFLIWLHKDEGPGHLPNPGSSGEINYTFFARSMDPGKVRYQINRVAGLYDTVPLPMPQGVTAGIDPGEFIAGPGQAYTSKVTVTIQPGSTPKEMIWLYIHAEVEGVPDAITDDWVRVAFDDGSFMSGAGLYHFHTGGGGYCQDMLVVPQGTTGQASFSIHTGELDTGNVTLGLVTSPCVVDHGPLSPDERPPAPEGIQVRIEPDRFTSRSFATYLSTMTFTVDKTVTPGDYCYSAVLRTPMGGGEYAAFTVRVVPGAG